MWAPTKKYSTTVKPVAAERWHYVPDTSTRREARCRRILVLDLSLACEEAPEGATLCTRCIQLIEGDTNRAASEPRD